jgi:N-acetylmuramic acid 6-phosphate (MurNAc-6-P) etherase
LLDSSGELKTAIVAVLTGRAVDEARQALARTSGSVRAALAAMDEPR